MQISEFIAKYNNHPILLIGTGMSLRYLNKSFSWDALLSHIAYELKNNEEYYLDLKANSQVNGKYQYAQIASNIEREFTLALTEDRNGKFKEVNDIFYANMRNGIKITRLKIYISKLLNDVTLKEEMAEEVTALKKIGKNVGSIITTNYDKFIENTLNFEPLIGNDILLSNPYGSVYKIHGCISDPLKVIITDEDYQKFDKKYELVRAQLLSLFIHNPIIFLGYGIGDENIKTILKTIFTYVEPNSPIAQKIKDNFLLVEHDAGSTNLETTDHDIDMDGFATIRINKIKTDDYKSIYESLASLNLPVSAMDVRKVQNIVKELYAGGDIKVKITEDLDELKNSDKIIAIGSHKTISYQYQTNKETITNYFNILDEENSQLLRLIDKFQISSSMFFPIFGFSKICPDIEVASKLKTQQVGKLQTIMDNATPGIKSQHDTIQKIIDDVTISNTNKVNAIIWSLMEDKVTLEDAEAYLRSYDKNMNTNFKKLICAFDYKKYNNKDEQNWIVTAAN